MDNDRFFLISAFLAVLGTLPCVIYLCCISPKAEEVKDGEKTHEQTNTPTKQVHIEAE